MPEIEQKRCIECGRVVTRDAQNDHTFRKRNDLRTTNVTCATCNNRYLEKWDIAGQLPQSPLDALMCFARRSMLLAQWSGQSELAEAYRTIEKNVIVKGGNRSRRRRRRRVAPESIYRGDLITAILDQATLCREMMEFLTPYVEQSFSSDHQILSIYARRIERNPALFLEYWESSEHAAMVDTVNRVLQLASKYDAVTQIDALKLFSLLMNQLVSEASSFLVWLKDRNKVMETVS